MAADRLTGLDTAFLSLESHASPMHLGALAIFRPVGPGPPGHPGRVAALVADRLAQLPQLRQRVQPAWFPLGTATWAEDPEFRVENHIHRHHLGGRGCRDQAATLAAALMVRPLPRNRPLWELHLISGLGGGRFAVLFKMHHAFGDGLNALEIGYGLLDGFSPKHGRQFDNSPAVTGSSALPPPVRLTRYVSDVRDAVVGGLGQLAEALGIAGAVLGSARLPSPGSPLVISSSDQRALALARLDLRQLHRARKYYGGTVNDVL
ncbi:MAG TPA: wax ester/triacylglycerol synthase domain-containing protein, partial [Pseudonocardiaceae bacterium]